MNKETFLIKLSIEDEFSRIEHTTKSEYCFDVPYPDAGAFVELFVLVMEGKTFSRDTIIEAMRDYIKDEDELGYRGTYRCS